MSYDAILAAQQASQANILQNGNPFETAYTTIFIGTTATVAGVATGGGAAYLGGGALTISAASGAGSAVTSYSLSEVADGRNPTLEGAMLAAALGAGLGVVTDKVLALVGNRLWGITPVTHVATGARRRWTSSIVRGLRANDDEAAAIAYEIIRESTTDVAAIARNTGLPEALIQRAKDHVFLSKHMLPDFGFGTSERCFDPDALIAGLWNAVRQGTPKKGGRTDQLFRELLAHELGEADLMAQGMPYRDAHELAPDPPSFNSDSPGF